MGDDDIMVYLLYLLVTNCVFFHNSYDCTYNKAEFDYLWSIPH